MVLSPDTDPHQWLHLAVAVVVVGGGGVDSGDSGDSDDSDAL